MAGNGNMNGFADHGLNEDNFGESNALKTVKAFDAFPKTKASYTQQSGTGGVWTIILVIASLWLAGTEVGRWWTGETTHNFDVEAGIGHDLQINFDVLIKMKCDDLNINVVDASGDRVYGSAVFKKDDTTWTQWDSYHTGKIGKTLGTTKEERMDIEEMMRGGEFKVQDVHDFLHALRGRKHFQKTPKLPRGVEADTCRIAGSMHTNKVQGDLHITARGHGYSELAAHLDHSAFNFTHHIMEMSFGPHYPALVNPLDNTLAVTEHHFHRFQYYLSVVPTTYTTDAKALRKMTDKHNESPTSGDDGMRLHKKRYAKDTIFTNQYAVTEQSHAISEREIPGVFVKYDIEPIMLTIAEEWDSVLALFIRIVNVMSGVLVAGGWLYTMSEWARDMRSRGRRSGAGYDGMIGPSSSSYDFSNGMGEKKVPY